MMQGMFKTLWLSPSCPSPWYCNLLIFILYFRSGIWELAGEGEKETLLQKYQRLQCEMKEFMEEVAALKVCFIVG